MTESNDLKSIMRDSVESELRACVDQFFKEKPAEFKEIIEYQMGWIETGKVNGAAGKRLRPIILLAACQALGMDWKRALPAAAAMELVHNFSLVHDDIQDRSELRRGKPTIWVKYGEAQAINIGDAILTAAFLELQRLSCETDILLSALQSLSRITLSLTTGQYLDLAYEHVETLSLSDYWKMVEGKTGALFGGCFSIPAILASEPIEKVDLFYDFGSKLGLAFQVQDDYLGIFGEEDMIGKSSASDLLDRKKTFPILYGLQNVPEFLDFWNRKQEFNNDDIMRLKSILEKRGVRDVNQNKSRQLYNEIEDDFDQLFGYHKNTEFLHLLITSLFDRKQ